MFKPVSAKVDFPKKERQVLKWWYDSGVVEKYLHKNDKAKKRFRFLDGPITANNPMGVHHAWGRTYKDFWQRYKNMQGFKQRFQNGFDCQGLWVEVEEEKNLGFNSKRDIEKFGLANFSQACRERVEKFSAIQTEQSKRLGMFMDWDNSYYTMSDDNNLYIWYFLKKCHKKGWLYKGVNVMPWCARCGTALSQHELSDGGYQIVQHESVYVRFPLKKEPRTSLLIWTTTPWTLLANVAVAVNKNLNYVKVKHCDEYLILSEERLAALGGNYKIVEKFKGSRLVGEQYQGPFDELPVQKGKNHKVIPWQEVSSVEGTGLVHTAPGAGPEDFLLAHKLDLPVIPALDQFGVYLPGFGKFTGKEAAKVKDEVFEKLREKSLLFRTEKIIHSYPHCWRCKEEVVFRMTEEWFIKADPIRPLMKKAAQTVTWIPESAGKRMQDWLTNMGDWPISRRRYWGLALPFWECPSGHLTVVGSLEELKTQATDLKKVEKLPELHRPWIDEIKLKCPKCGEGASRTPFVGDCWLDAGIVPFSTLEYLEDRTHWKKWFPAGFITEYIAQIKLWFYSLLFMSVTLENRAPYEVVHTTEFVVDEKGETMHKSKGNAIWFGEAAERMGVDVMRWLYLRADNTSNLRFGFKLGDEVRRRFHLILWNVYNFFITYANVDEWQPKKQFSTSNFQLSVLDNWILTRLNDSIRIITEALDSYDAFTASHTLEDFVQILSTWYVRRSRDRVGPTATDGEEKNACYSTLYEVLMTLSKLLAPFTPFLAEEIYQNLRVAGSKSRVVRNNTPRATDNAPISVHLCDWPKADENSIDKKLEERMSLVRKVCELGHAERKRLGIKVRQPLKSAKCELQNAQLTRERRDLVNLIKEELNLRSIELIEAKEEKFEFNTKLTPQLASEGEARELIRQIQELRKQAGCKLDERITVYAPVWPQKFTDYIQGKTLAKKLMIGKKVRIVRES